MPVAKRPSAPFTPASISASVFTSVTVIAALTSAVVSASPSTTTMVLIVPADAWAGGDPPAVIRLLSPTVAIASAVSAP